MKLKLLFVFFFISGISISQTELLIELIDNKNIKLNQAEVSLNNLKKDVSQFLSQKNTTELVSITIDIDNITTDSLVEAVKNQLKFSAVDVLNFQRRTISNFTEGTEVTEPMIVQYNTLVKTWKSTPESQRYYREIELEFVENLYKSMSFAQQVNAEKLPSFLPIFDQKPNIQPIDQFKFEQWIFDRSYLIKINGHSISKEELKEFEPKEFKSYHSEKRIINEEKREIINLIKA